MICHHDQRQKYLQQQQLLGALIASAIQPAEEMYHDF
jgi:hypothetical protein